MEEDAIRTFDFYEFAGVLVPGVLLLFCVGYFIPSGPAVAPLFLPRDMGSAAVHIILAYGVGHLVQAIGNLLEVGYWRLQRGMPTDWPFTQPRPAFPERHKTLLGLLVPGAPLDSLQDWRRAISAARSAISAQGLGTRLQVFNGNYGMFRGIAVVGLLALGSAWYFLTNHLLSSYIVLLISTALAVYRMDRFARHYAREFFACCHLLARQQMDSKSPAQREG